MNPVWNRGALALTGALERAGKLDEAKQIYERALQHSPHDAQLRARHAHLLWRLRQPEAAFEEAEHALRIAPGYVWPWDLLRGWAADRGEPKRAGDFARALTTERPGEMRCWVMLAQALEGPDAVSERLAAVDRALELNPRDAETWDLKAELLARAERFDDAVQTTLDGTQACTTEVHILRGRQAWIEARRNRLPEAVRLMRDVLAENAAYVWGWNQIAHWLLKQGAIVDAAAALETLQRLRPHDAWVLQQLGLLKLKQDDRVAAQKFFGGALRISPTDAYSAQNLFDLQLKSADLQGAAETLRVMQTHQPGAATQAAEIFLLLRKNEIKAACALLEKLCASADPDAWPLDASADAFRRASQSRNAVKIFRRAIKSGSCHPQVGTAAIRLLFAQGRVWSAVWLFFGLKPGELQRGAAAPLVHELADRKSGIPFRWLLWRRRQVLASDDEAWGQVGYALSQFKSSEQAASWLSDWRTRRNVQPWMLFNLCLGLRQLGRYEEATEVVRYAIEKWGHRDGSADLRLFLAVEDALFGKLTDAQQHLKQVSIRQKVAYDQDLLALAKALVEFQQSPAAERVQQFKAVQVQLGKRFVTNRMLGIEKDARRTFSRAGRVFIEQGGGWRAKLWFGWRLNWQWLLTPLIPIVILFPPALIVAWIFWRRRPR
jgi:tetratricopeptide (TPR) repeat protein